MRGAWSPPRSPSPASDAGTGTLRAAIELANLAPDHDTITFDAAVRGTITLTTPLPDLVTDVDIAGPGASELTVARSAAEGAPAFRIFTIPADAMVAISGLTITRGRASQGGGISNAGRLSVSASTLIANLATGGDGGGIYSIGTLTVSGSTISGNSAIGGYGGVIYEPGCGGGYFPGPGCLIYPGNGSGGGIYSAGPLNLSGSTVSGNLAKGGVSPVSQPGGAAGGWIYSAGPLTVSNSTLSANSAIVEFFNSGQGGGIYIAGLLSVSHVANTIFVNTTGGNIVVRTSSEFVSQGHNLFSDAPAAPLASTDLINTDPLLAPLGDYGGHTFTHALLPGSPAIDGGASLNAADTDQRGVARPQGAAPDIGAFESRGFTLTITGGDDQKATTGSPFVEPLAVVVTSPYGEPVGGGHAFFEVPETGASATLDAPFAILDESGRASVSASANTVPGQYSVAARVADSGGVAFTLVNVGIPPTVVGLERVGIHYQPTTLRLTFSGPLNPGSAQDARNYTILPVGHLGRGRFGSRPIPVASAVYDSATYTVSLAPSQRLNLRGFYRLNVSAASPNGVKSADGLPLDGSGDGGPGSDYTALVHGFGASTAKAPAVVPLRIRHGALGLLRPILPRRWAY